MSSKLGVDQTLELLDRLKGALAGFRRQGGQSSTRTSGQLEAGNASTAMRPRRRLAAAVESGTELPRRMPLARPAEKAATGKIRKAQGPNRPGPQDQQGTDAGSASKTAPAAGNTNFRSN